MSNYIWYGAALLMNVFLVSVFLNGICEGSLIACIAMCVWLHEGFLDFFRPSVAKSFIGNLEAIAKGE